MLLTIWKFRYRWLTYEYEGYNAEKSGRIDLVSGDSYCFNVTERVSDTTTVSRKR